jgi:hypothetical protein
MHQQKNLSLVNYLYYSSAKEDEMRVLFVADPQLIGHTFEGTSYGFISRWDSDR